MAEPLPDASPATAARPSPAGEGLRRQWQQPLGDVHVKLGNLVGAASLQFSFDCSDQDFVLALTTRWPIGVDSTSSLYETDMLKLAEALNGLARLYAIETGTTHLHVLLEARRGSFKLPGWWDGAPVLFATYAFDTANAQVGLFADAGDAAEDMPLLNQPHRLLVAIGPATPELATANGEEVLLDADEERLRALKRWNQQLALQINTLLADTFAGGEEEIEKVVEALSKVRNLSTRLALHILQREQQRARAKKKPADALSADLYEARRHHRARRDAPSLDAADTLSGTIGELKEALQSEPLERAIAPARRAELRKELEALAPDVTTAAPAPARKKAPAATLAGPTAALVALLLLATPAYAKDPASFGTAPYRDTLKYYEYTPNDDARLADGGNGRISPQSTWHGAAPKPCAARLRTAAHRKFGREAKVDVKENGDHGVALIDGDGYAYRCQRQPGRTVARIVSRAYDRYASLILCR